MLSGGTSTTRSSDTPNFRICQGNPKPGTQPRPPNVRLNNRAWISSESSSAYVSRARPWFSPRLSVASSSTACSGVSGSGSQRRVGASLGHVEVKGARPSLLGRRRGTRRVREQHCALPGTRSFFGRCCGDQLRENHRPMSACLIAQSSTARFSSNSFKLSSALRVMPVSVCSASSNDAFVACRSPCRAQAL